MAKLVVFSHKPCWPSADSPSGFATDGGFPFQMRTLSELFDTTVILVPCQKVINRKGEIPITGNNLSIVPLTYPFGKGLSRKIGLLWWLLENGPRMFRQALSADLIHSPIPGDIGTFGMLLAIILRKPLFVRHCGNWEFQRTIAERFWRRFMERHAGSRNLMLATGGSPHPPSKRNPSIRWIFSTSLTRAEIVKCREHRRTINIDRARLIIVCRQERFKGTDLVLESLPGLLRDFPQMEQDIVGDGSALAEFKRRAEHLGLNDRVKFHGRLDHEGVLRLLKGADLFFYPTRSSEGFPKAVLEALACGLPIITTSVSVLPQLVATGCGVLVKEATPEALANAVRECLLDSRRYQEMSAKALATAEPYTLERWRDQIRDLLREIEVPLRQDV